MEQKQSTHYECDKKKVQKKSTINKTKKKSIKI